MNKMEYQKPWAEFVQFDNEDVITSSNPVIDPGHDSGCPYNPEHRVTGCWWPAYVIACLGTNGGNGWVQCWCGNNNGHGTQSLNDIDDDQYSGEEETFEDGFEDW